MGASSNSMLDTNVSNFVTVKLSCSGNYLLWKAQMLCLLDSNNMGGIVDDTFVGPTADCSAESMRQYDSVVRGWIFGSVTEDVLVDVFNLVSAKAVWDKLRCSYDPTMVLEEDSTPNESDENTEKEDSDVVSAETQTLETHAAPIEIIVTEGIVPTETEDAQKSENKKKLLAATVKGDWSQVESILKKDEGLVTEPISSDGSTALHLMVGIGHNDLLKNFLPKINDEQVLQQRDYDGSTALHIAGIVGNKNAAELLVKKNNNLLRIEDHEGKDPLHKAYEYMHLDTIGYLLKSVTSNDFGERELQSSLSGSVHPSDQIGIDLLVNAITAKQYTLALDLVHKFPNFASKSDDVLMAIAKTFPSGPDDKDIFFLLIGVYVLWLSLFLNLIFADHYHQATFKYVYIVLFIICVSVLIHKKGLLRMVYAFVMKTGEQDIAKKVLRLVCDEIDKSGYSGTHHPCYTRPILEAACHNAYEVVVEILYRSPQAIDSTDKNGYDIIQLAIIHRSKAIYNLIYNIGERKNLYRTMEDCYKNNILHLVGRLPPSSVLNQRRGAALQLQQELQWREEVKKFVFPAYITKENIFKETPNMIFTKEHKELVKEGEKWFKTTANSCTITAALITTIVFSGAITVPGGNIEGKGTPVFIKNKAFITFAVSDAISLFTSSTALLVFLSILTARFDEKDFLVRLPRRLFIGLLFLLVSTISMIIAFSTSVFLVFRNQKPHALAPIIILASIQIIIFVMLQFPLMIDLLWSTRLDIPGKLRNIRPRRFNLIDIRLRFGN